MTSVVPVRGRIDGGAGKLSAERTPTALNISCEDKNENQLVMSFDPNEVFQDTFNGTLTSLKLEGPIIDLRMEACFDPETMVLRFDSPDELALWIEIDMKAFKEKGKKRKKDVLPDPFKDMDEETLDDCLEELCQHETVDDIEQELKAGYNNCTKEQAMYWLKKKYLETTTHGEDLYRRLIPNELVKWSTVDRENAILTLWPGAAVYAKDLPELINFFKDTFDIEPTPVGCVETLPDKDEAGVAVPGTGGRIDFFFFVDQADMRKFAFKRFQYGMRWWQDVYFNNGEDIYPDDFRAVYEHHGVFMKENGGDDDDDDDEEYDDDEE